MAEIYFRIGDRILCIDASPNRRCAILPLARGKIYVVRAIEITKWKSARSDWTAPGWGLHLEGLWIWHPDVGCEWPIHPNRFRPVIDRATDIEIFKKLLKPTQLKLPFGEEKS
jgi:hypothetical protein